MTIKREDNPFEDEIIAHEWIQSVEGEKGMVRDREIYPMLEAWASRISGTVVEIGSGQGICSQHLGEFEGKYIGVEPSEVLNERANEIYGSGSHLEFKIGNAYELPVESGCVDGVFSVNVWFHLADLNKASCELSRILKSGSSFNIITSNPENNEAWRNFFEDYTEDGKLISGKVRVPINSLSRNDVYLHTMKEMIDALEQASLTVKTIQPLGVISAYPGNPIFVSIQGMKQD